MKRPAFLADLAPAAFWAGVTAFIWYAFGAVPLHLGVSDQLGLTAAQTSSWIFIVWFSGAVSSIALTLHYRQPIPITWTIPGLVYIGTLAGDFTYAEVVGASLLTGALIVALGIVGVGGWIMRWLPLPIILGMFGGSILAYMTRLVGATAEHFAVAGAAVAGYLVGRVLRSQRVPPVGLAIVTGGVAVAVTGEIQSAQAVAWTLPQLAVPSISFSTPAFVAITLPLLVLSMGMGNVQGLGFLAAQGYQVPVNRITVVVGINSLVNALLGGHPAIVARTGVAIVASPDAGPIARRYWANLVAAGLTVVIALAAMPVSSLLAVLPRAYIVTLAGLAILPAFQDALEKSLGTGRLRMGTVVAFLVAATPLTFVGITSAFWAIVAGLMISVLVERDDLFQYWQVREPARQQ